MWKEYKFFKKSVSPRFRRLNIERCRKNEFLLIHFFSPIFHIVYMLYLFVQSYELFYFLLFISRYFKKKPSPSYVISYLVLYLCRVKRTFKSLISERWNWSHTAFSSFYRHITILYESIENFFIFYQIKITLVTLEFFS